MHILEGNISVKAAILAGHREIEKVIVDIKKKDKDTNFILAKAYERNIPVEKVDREEINKLADGKTHGGLLALCGERNYQTLEEVNKDRLFLAFIEGVEDPFNFGNILRVLYAAGCQGVIVPERNWTSAASTVAKSSAGASEYMDIIVAHDLNETLVTLHKYDIPLLCAQRSDAISLYDYTFPDKFCIAIGGEMRGLSKLTLSHSSQNIYIPYNQEFRNAMSASSATAIIAFEYVRQQQ